MARNDPASGVAAWTGRRRTDHSNQANDDLVPRLLGRPLRPRRCHDSGPRSRAAARKRSHVDDGAGQPCRGPASESESSEGRRDCVDVRRWNDSSDRRSRRGPVASALSTCADARAGRDLGDISRIRLYVDQIDDRDCDLRATGAVGGSNSAPAPSLAMKFPRFDMERLQSVWEHKVKYDLSESGVEALTLDEITRDPKELLKTRLGYAEGVGREATRTLIAGIHEGHDADDVMITTGTSEANFLTLASLVSSGDEVVVVMPNYMQVHGIAAAPGALVREVWLREERAWTIDLDALAAAVNARTKVICVCQPNNPTGQILSQAEVQSVVRIADREGAWILADEVYRGAERSAEESPSFSGRGEC